MESVMQIMESLKQIGGLANFNILTEKDKRLISSIEEIKNIGVFESLKRSCTIVLTHDSKFRGPSGPIVLDDIFPPVPFPEVKAKSVVSSSPGIKVHSYLVNRFNLNLSAEEATLLVGFEL